MTDIFEPPLEDGFTVAHDAVDIAAATVALMSSVNEETFPDIDPPADTFVTLPGGLYLDDVFVNTAEVKELTGEDEEEIARSLKTRDPVRFVATLVRVGTKRIGDQEVDKNLVKRLLLGDRDALLVGISRATFGEDLEYKGFMCPGCAELLDIEYQFSEIPVRKLEDPTQRRWTVPLSKGRIAEIRMPNVADEEKVYANPDSTDPERDSIFLANIIVNMIDPAGNNLPTGLGAVKKMGSSDRRTLIKFVRDTMPGPRYDEVKFTHEDCGQETFLPVGVEQLFRDL